MVFEQALLAMRNGKRITRAEIYPTFYYMKADRLFKRDGEDGEEYEVEILHVDYCLMCEDWYLYEKSKDKQKDNILKLIDKVENADFVDKEVLILCNCIKQQQQQITDIQKELGKLTERMNHCNID